MLRWIKHEISDRKVDLVTDRSQDLFKTMILIEIVLCLK